MTTGDFYQQFTSALQTIYTPSESSLITKWVFEKLVLVNTLDQAAAFEKELHEHNRQQLEIALASLLQHKPVQYVLGETWFYNLKFLVNEQVLIPRPETEELVQWVIDDCRGGQNNPGIIDIGTGSGCIAIALQKKLPQATTTAIDLSAGALNLAQRNAAALNAPVNFMQVDFLNEKEWTSLPKFDIIISNPPYIPEQEKNVMDANVLLYEPHTALFVPDKTPLIFYEKMLAFAKSHLAHNGSVYLEVHKAHAMQTKALFESTFKSVVLQKDISGNDRMVKATHFR